MKQNSIVIALMVIGGVCTAPFVHAHTLKPELIEKITGESVATSTEKDMDSRGEIRTFATFPEWYIVYSAQEYADFAKKGERPSNFPYFGAIGQYWDSVEYATKASGGAEIDSETKTVLRFIGASFSLEYGITGLYEKTIGFISEAMNLFYETPEDRFTEGVAAEYAAFLYHTPWYSFPYFEKITGLWSTFGAGSITPRGVERRIIFSISYAAKGVYGALTGYLSRTSLGGAGLETEFVVSNISKSKLESISGIEILETYNDGHILAKGPRYRAFTDVAKKIMDGGGVFLEVEGNTRIMFTAVAPSDTACLTERSDIAFVMPFLSDPAQSRFAILSEVADLHTTAETLRSCGVTIEHIYDY